MKGPQNYTTDYAVDIQWYAIGVGEEDTSLRDSLADILENKGVDVTEEDDMASLITKVDEEFTKSITVVSSDEVFMTQHNFVPTSKPNSYQGKEPIQLFKLIATFNGSITCSTTLRQSNNEYNAYLDINHIRDNVVITTKSYQTTTTLEINCLIENILPGDVIEITGHTTTGLSNESMVLSAPVVLYGSIVK